MNGVCSKLVDSFPDVFVFFSRTCSPGNTGLNMATRLLSAYALAVSLWFQSRSQTFSSRMFLSLRSSGNFVFSSLPNMTYAGVTPVLTCGVVLYANRNFTSSPFYPFPSTCATLSAFKSVRFCLSTSPFACGHKGGDVWCSIPCSSKKLLNSSDWN